MAEKFVPRHTVGSEINKKSDKSRFVGDFLNANVEKDEKSRVEYKQIRVDEITPRFINKYRQSRIEQLADSIRNTNNRLIHPIVVVKAEDLPEGHEVRKAIEDQGKSVSDFKYIIVSGERRYHAWMLLREQERAKIGKKLGVTNQFDTITANVLTKTEALNEKAYYADANNQARHLSPAEGIWFIKDALKEVQTDEQKRDALIKLNGGSAAGIDEDPKKAASKFRIDNYCRMLLENELGVSDWSDGTLRNMATVAMNCDDRVADALLSGDYVLREAKQISSLPQEEQIRLIELFKENRDVYEEELARIKNAGSKKTQKVTHADTRRQLKAALKRARSEKQQLERIASALGSKYNRNELDAIKKYDTFIADLEVLIQNTK